MIPNPLSPYGFQKVVRANIFAMNCGVVKGEPINVGSNQSYTINRVAEMVGGQYKCVEPRAGDIKHSLADITKARELLGWEPRVSLEEGIVELKKVYGLHLRPFFIFRRRRLRRARFLK